MKDRLILMSAAEEATEVRDGLAEIRRLRAMIADLQASQHETLQVIAGDLDAQGVEVEIIAFGEPGESREFLEFRRGMMGFLVRHIEGQDAAEILAGSRQRNQPRTPVDVEDARPAEVMTVGTGEATETNADHVERVRRVYPDAIESPWNEGYGIKPHARTLIVLAMGKTVAEAWKETAAWLDRRASRKGL
jgi:hypothetical protein